VFVLGKQRDNFPLLSQDWVLAVSPKRKKEKKKHGSQENLAKADAGK